MLYRIKQTIKKYDMEDVDFNFVKPIEWLPKGVQGNSNLCSLFVIGMYDHISSIKGDLPEDVSDLVKKLSICKRDNLKKLYKSFESKIKPRGDEQVYFG